MFDAVLDVLFPVAFLMIPVMGVLWLSTKVFGIADTKAAVTAVVTGVLYAGRETGQCIGTAVMMCSRGLRRGVAAFLGYDTNDGDITVDSEELIEVLRRTSSALARLEMTMALLRERVAADETDDVEAGLPF
jgi:hypothetical protein